MVWYNITAYNLKVKFVLRNNKENVICNNKNAEGVMQMKCSKNLERAIVLGLILSTGVCGSAWAKDFTWYDSTDKDGSGTGAVIESGAFTEYENVNVLLDKIHQNYGDNTTCALAVKNKTELKVNNTDGDFSVVNNIKNNISLEEVQKIQNTTLLEVLTDFDGFKKSVYSIFDRIDTFENNALFAAGSSLVEVNTNSVKIIATGGFTGLNAAISAENDHVDKQNIGNNTISIKGNKVEIVGDVDMTKGAQDQVDTINTVNLTLSSSDSYWYGSERRGLDENGEAWNGSKLNLTLANGAEWVYDNNVLLGKSKQEIFDLIKDVMIHDSITNIDFADKKIDEMLNEKLGFLKSISSNEGSEISAIALEGGKVILQDEYIKQKYGIYESDIIDILAGNKHQKVTIGELKGKGGIFKVDLDWATNKGTDGLGQKKKTENSDYIYIEKMGVDENGFDAYGNSTQIIDFDASKAHLEDMKINEDKLYFANVADGGTVFETVTGEKAVYSGTGNIYNYEYGVNSDNNEKIDWYVEVTGKSAEGNANFESAKGAMYAGYALGTELDTLNKRMGEARYLEEDDGVWVRYRHSKTGWDDTYETNGDMFQLGFDNEVTEKDGRHYRGVAIDYTDADTNIMGISGEGEHERYAVSLYDTWLGEKGHYRDLVLRGGRINSDYDVSGAFSNGYEDIGGDYHQWFGSISAEWGRKNDMGTGWYFEPQIQAQLARVGGASYVSDSGIDVDQDGATSLIGRAGFRIGREYVKDNGKHDNFYIKADLLHEFAGDKSFSLTGNDGRYDKEYDGQETWCDVGIGADISLGKNSYFWADVERTFGADFDNTWQINGGFRWEF